ncbi:MAG: hypothetical protein FWG63_07260 [Defluviitaleaceae bacterium]|nr:hypothetical protein [Defluviitaleaceae bacterium]
MNILASLGFSIVFSVVFGVIFTLIAIKLRYTEKVLSKLENRRHRIVLFVLVVVITAVASTAGGVASERIFGFDNELLSTIVRWSIFGAILPFAIGIPIGRKDEKER